jgi:hypothetical protein
MHFAGRNAEQIELPELGKNGIIVAEYLTVLPPRELQKFRLHATIEQARNMHIMKDDQ